jgi:hypothetical protein
VVRRCGSKAEPESSTAPFYLEHQVSLIPDQGPPLTGSLENESDILSLYKMRQYHVWSVGAAAWPSLRSRRQDCLEHQLSLRSDLASPLVGTLENRAFCTDLG